MNPEPPCDGLIKAPLNRSVLLSFVLRIDPAITPLADRETFNLSGGLLDTTNWPASFTISVLVNGGTIVPPSKTIEYWLPGTGRE